MKTIKFNFKRKTDIFHDVRFFHILILGILFQFSCSNQMAGLKGSWIQPIPGQADQVQGIRLEAEGKASSINMHTLLYETWDQQGMKLILTGKSIGNGQTISFSDTLDIGILSSDTLVLKRNNFEERYVRSYDNY